MSETLVWLVAAIALYTAFCLYCGVATARSATDAKTFFLADRNLPAWAFVLTGTVASFSAWFFLGQGEMVAREGLPFAETGLGAITIPLAGVLFMKRQWMLAKRFGYVTPAEMLGDYFESEAIRVLVLIVALVFAAPFMGLQLAATARLIGALSDGAIDPTLAMWVLTGFLFAYVCIGGLPAAALAGALQALLLGAGIALVGLFALWQAGGFGAFNQALADLAKSGSSSPRFEIPGVMQFTAGLGVQAPAGGAWTAMMIGSYCLGLMGLQLMPGFGMLAFAARSPKGFAAQQVWAAAGAIGAILVLFASAQGLGAHLPALAGRDGLGVVADLIGRLRETAPWFVGILAVAALAAAQGLAALLLSTTSTLVVRDGFRRYFRPDLDIAGQRLYARIAMALIAVVSLLLATFAPGAEAALGALAIGFGFQLLPALAGLCWLPWITREGATVGLVAGMAGVLFTEPLGLSIASFFGLHLPWGRWPWTIHSAAWGMACNAAACLVISLISQRREATARRQAFHDFLRTHSAPPPGLDTLRPLAWAVTLLWLFFAIGPGAVYGNWAFGASRGGIEAWLLGVPPLWAWQILWWALGVVMIWFLADRLGLSTQLSRRFEPLPRSQRPASDVAALSAGGAQQWLWIALGLGALAVFANWLFG